MRRIVKTTMGVQDSIQAVTIPADGVIVHVGFTPETTDQYLSVWLEVDVAKAMTVRDFVILRDGQDVPEGGVYVGTAQNYSVDQVWHLYEIPAQTTTRTGK